MQVTDLWGNFTQHQRSVVTRWDNRLTNIRAYKLAVHITLRPMVSIPNLLNRQPKGVRLKSIDRSVQSRVLSGKSFSKNAALFSGITLRG